MRMYPPLMVVPALLAVAVRASGAQVDGDGARVQVRVLTWNVQYGRRNGADLNKWPERAPVLLRALKKNAPDVFCAQEALDGQVREISKALPGHSFVATGRDDGKSGGEHCPIFYDKAVFQLQASGTFWLSDTPDVPSRTWGNPYIRICTWVVLRHHETGTVVRVMNTHFPLAAAHRRLAADLVARRFGTLPAMPTILVGDFNEPKGLTQFSALSRAGFSDAYDTAQKRLGGPTYRLGPIAVARIDWVLTTGDWDVTSLEVVDASHDGVHASDHNGVLAAVALVEGRREPQSPILRVLTYNVEKGSRTEDIARVIRSHAPDVALLQEVDKGTTRVGGQDQPERLGAMLQMHMYYAPSYKVDGGTTGQAILSRHPLEDCHTVTLARSRNIAAQAAITWRDRRILLISTHFSSTYKLDLDHAKESAAARLREADRIVGIVREATQPTIVGGDLNCGPESPPMRTLTRALNRVTQNAPTFPAAYPVLTLDHVLFTGGLSVRRTIVGAKGTSDHLPVIVEFSAGGEGAGERRE